LVSIYFLTNNQIIKIKKMKKVNLMITAALMLTGFAACNNEASEAEQNAAELNAYVDSIENLTPVYTTAYWTTLDDGYQIRVVKADGSIATLSDAERAKLEASENRYAALKATYALNILEAEKADASNYRTLLRNKLFGEGMIGSDMSFGFATANNLLSIYRNFVNTVADNRDSFTREDWDEIKVLYEALDSRKNTVEKELPKGDNLKIAGLKIKFASLKATNRDGAKATENREAKQ
jgi:hypothetical protein